MAFDLMRSAKHIRGLSNAEFRVLFYLLEAANQETFKCYPSIKKISKYTDMAERTVQRHISALADRGLFERVEQRRDDGSRQVNCYKFTATGVIKIGNEAVIQIGTEIETEVEQQPANNGGLHNPPFQTGGGVNPDGGWCQSRRDIDQESEPVIRTYPPSSDEEGTPIEKCLFGDPIPIGDDAVIEFVDEQWGKLKTEFPRITGIRRIDDALRRQILLRAKQHTTQSETRIDVWHSVFDQIRSSQFLTGRVPPGPGRDTPFKLSLGWLCKTMNFREVINGKYASDRGNSRAFGADGQRLGPTGQAVAGTLERMRASKQRR